MAAKTLLQLAADATKKILNLSYVRGADTVHVQGTQIMDADDDDLILRVVAAGTLQAVPTGLSDLILGSCKVGLMFFVNTAAVPRTITVQDGQGSPLKLLDAFEVPPKAFLTIDLKLAKVLTKLSWQASGAGLNGFVIAYQ